jgi:hypothetical protein
LILASVELTLEQIVDAVRQLPEAQRKELLRVLESLPTPAQARATARQIRESWRLRPKDRKRLTALLAKGNAGTLTAAESQELDRLVEQFEQNTLDMARTLAAGAKPPKGRKAGESTSSP